MALDNLPIELRTMIASRPELRFSNRTALGFASKGWQQIVRDAPGLTDKQQHLLRLVQLMLALAYEFTMIGLEMPGTYLNVIDQIQGSRMRTNRGIISKRTLYNLVVGDFARCHRPMITMRFTHAPTPAQLTTLDSIFSAARSVSVRFPAGGIVRRDDGLFTLRGLLTQRVLDRAQIVAYIASFTDGVLRSTSFTLT